MEHPTVYKSTHRADIISWCPDIEPGAMAQAYRASELPFVHQHIALMPDCHQGYGVPIGSVVCTDNVIIPNAVGVDIGCGMYAVKTNYGDCIDPSTIKNIMSGIRKRIPMGKGKSHDQPAPTKWMPINSFNMRDEPVYYKEYDNAVRQLGTLGGGNHFIEIQRDSDGIIWFMIHSGSRNLGHKIATHYNDLAKELNKKWHNTHGSQYDLAFLPVESDEGQLYIKEMQIATMYAQANREFMADRVKAAILEYCPEIDFDHGINVAHNYARQEHHYGKNVWVHRKGATSAKQDELGIIPGSQGTPSYIVKGLGNPKSFTSCSHGAGRLMGRNQAKKTLDYEEEMLKMGDVIHGMRSAADLDEAPGSYKCISEVMFNQRDLVRTVTELKPLAVMKG
jgi:tRNA-splicing ligase RtcB